MTNSEALTDEILNIYRKNDSEISKILKPCKKGCNSCCYQNVRIVKIEKYIIEGYLEKEDKKRREIHKNILDWFAYFNNNTPVGKTITSKELTIFDFRVVMDRYPCPFLVDFECSIYEARPIVCRTFFIENPGMEPCENTVTSASLKSSQFRETAEKELINLSPDLYFIPLLYSVVDVYGFKHKVKPIERLSVSYGVA